MLKNSQKTLEKNIRQAYENERFFATVEDRIH